MMCGSARIVAVRSPPPSCMITIEPAWTWLSTARLTLLPVAPAAQSRGSTDHSTSRTPRLDAIVTTWSDHPPPGGRKSVACTFSAVSWRSVRSIWKRTVRGRCSPNGGTSGCVQE